MTENQKLLFYNVLYFNALKLLFAFLETGYLPDSEMVDAVRTIGKLGAVPEDQLNYLEMIEFHSVTLH